MKEFIRRLLFFIFFIICADIIVNVTLPAINQEEFDRSYRLPDNQELIMLPFYIDHIRNKQYGSNKNIIFMGSSPTYGTKIKNPVNTYPGTYQQELKNAANDSRVYNVSAKGFLISDLYYILKKVVSQGDYFIIQLNYHTFNSDFLKSTKIRYPELPQKIGAVISYDEAALLGLRNTPTLALNYGLESIVNKYWTFYREKDRIASAIFGSTPELFFFKNYKKIMGKINEDEEVDPNDFNSFCDMSPKKQMIIVKRYGNSSHFQIKEDNVELMFLEKVLSLLEANKKKAVFFIAPINVQALNDYEVMKWNEYKKNMNVIAEEVKKHNYLFLDYNPSHTIGCENFFDISHTLDDGGKAFGKMLFKDTQKYLF